MTPRNELRRLAAIMFTDMVGYTALAQRDEPIALELLEEHRSLLRSVFPLFGGQEIKTIGDAFLVEFSSALDAARCAIEIQRKLSQRNLSAPAERQVQVRIGIHVGDIIHREGDVLGDGVNIASRIEPLAEPGGICISVDVAHQIQHNLETAVVKVGEATLKNVQVPLEICRIVLPWERTERAALGGKQTRRWRPTSKLVLLTGALLLSIGCLCWWLARPQPSKPLTKTQAAPVARVSQPATGAEHKRSVAVLPFANLSVDAADEYLSDGLTEELIGLLVRVPGLRVPARTSAFVFKNKQEDIRRIGEVLSVEMVLEGSVRKSSNHIRVTAQLISVADGFHLWSETYDREVGDLLVMQQEIARQIVQKLRLELGGEVQQQMSRRVTQSPEAHELYLKGLYWWNKRTKPGLEQAIKFFNQALDQDPAFAVAYAALAASYVVMPEYTLRPGTECVPKAQAAAKRALELDPSLAEAHAVLGLANREMWDWAGAETEFKRAISLNPAYATAHHWYSSMLRIQGRLNEAMIEIRRAQELDPLSLIILVNLGQCFDWAGQHDRAIQEYQKAAEINSDFVMLRNQLGHAYLNKGMLSEARSEFERVRASSGESPFGLGILGYALGRSGNRAEALDVLARLDEFASQGYAVQRERAYVYYGLGDRDKTFEYLERAWRDREDLLCVLKAEPFLQDLHSDPRSKDLLRKINLAQ